MRDLKTNPQEFDVVEVEVRHSDHRQDVTISIEDPLSGLHFVEVTLPWIEFAKGVLTNVHAVRGSATLRVSPHLGKQHEHRHVTLDAEGLMGLRDPEQFATAIEVRFLTEHEDLYLDGWRPAWHSAKSYNGHRRAEGNRYSISVERWVEV